MTTVDKLKIRNAIFDLHRNGRAEAAAQVWDLYDAYNELELELVLQAAANSPEVAEVENILKANPDAGQIAGDLAQRCQSSYLHEGNERLVQCQRFAGHEGEHSHGLIDHPTTEYVWTDADAFVFAAVAPASVMSFDVDICGARYAGHPEAPNSTLHCFQAAGHDGEHRDVVAPLTWKNTDVKAAGRQEVKTAVEQQLADNA